MNKAFILSIGFAENYEIYLPPNNNAYVLWTVTDPTLFRSSDPRGQRQEFSGLYMHKSMVEVCGKSAFGPESVPRMDAE